MGGADVRLRGRRLSASAQHGADELRGRGDVHLRNTMRRCPSTVRTLTCNAAAISLDVLPGDQQLHDLALARREVREAVGHDGSVRRSPRVPGDRSRCAARTRSSSSLGGAGFCRKSTAPAFSARTEVGTLPWPVRTMIGSVALRRRSSSCRSRPLLRSAGGRPARRQPGALRVVGGEELLARGDTSRPRVPPTRGARAATCARRGCRRRRRRSARPSWRASLSRRPAAAAGAA